MLAALCFSTGGMFMKRAEGLHATWDSVVFLLLFALGAVLQSQAMRGAALSLTYILVLGLEAGFAVGFGVFFFGEGIPPLKLGGILLIVLGIALVRGR